MYPIWKDYFVTLANTEVAAGVPFSVDILGETIYSGRAFARPGSGNIVSRLNDIIVPYLVRGLSIIGETDVPVIGEEVEIDEGSAYVSETFRADWSYDDAFDPNSDGMNFPICDIVLPGQYVPHTDPISRNIDFNIVTLGASGGMFDASFNESFAIFGDVPVTATIANGGIYQTAWLDLRDYPTATAVEVGGRNYRVGGGCRQYALYYVNAYGGWDTLAVLGKTAESDAITRHTTERVYDNRQASARGKVNYCNELKHQYIFHTHPLTSPQCARMHHLLNSPLVYLHDVSTGLIRPIVLTGNVTEYKQQALNVYAIEAELAQDRIRR